MVAIVAVPVVLAAAPAAVATSAVVPAGAATTSAAVATSAVVPAGAATTTAAVATSAVVPGAATTTAAVITEVVAEAAAPSILAGISGPVAWGVLFLGAEASPDDYTWDCWKGILHDTSSEPSKGKLFRDVVTDDRVKTVYSPQADGASHMIVENIWEESYRMDPVVLPWNEVALHATRLM